MLRFIRGKQLLLAITLGALFSPLATAATIPLESGVYQLKDRGSRWRDVALNLFDVAGQGYRWRFSFERNGANVELTYDAAAGTASISGQVYGRVRINGSWFNVGLGNFQFDYTGISPMSDSSGTYNDVSATTPNSNGVGTDTGSVTIDTSGVSQLNLGVVTQNLVEFTSGNFMPNTFRFGDNESYANPFFADGWFVQGTPSNWHPWYGNQFFDFQAKAMKIGDLPPPDPNPDIPEPGTFVLLGVGLTALLHRRRAQRQ